MSEIHNDVLLSKKLILNATICTKILLGPFFNFNVDAWASTNTYLYFRLKNISVDEIVPQVYEQESRSLEFAITHSIRYTESILMFYKKLNVLRIDYIKFNVRQNFMTLIDFFVQI